MERQLLSNMIKSKESLEWVCDSIINDRKIPHVANAYDLKQEFKTGKGGQNTETLEINKRQPRYPSKMVLQTSSPNRMERLESPTRASNARRGTIL